MRSFEEIDSTRKRHGLSRKAIYGLAGVHKETWRRLDKGETSPTLRTLEKLSTALDALISEKEGAQA